MGEKRNTQAKNVMLRVHVAVSCSFKVICLMIVDLALYF